MAGFAVDPTVLPSIPERKGSLYLRSDHMRYGLATLNSNWHGDREAEPKDYEICGQPTENRNLLRATYDRISNMTDGTTPTTLTRDSTEQVFELMDDHRVRERDQPMVDTRNFSHFTSPRVDQQAGGGGSMGVAMDAGGVLPRHMPQHNARHLDTIHQIEYKYPLDWSPKPESPQDMSTVTKYRRVKSEFTETDDHRRPGLNTWQDCAGRTDKD